MRGAHFVAWLRRRDEYSDLVGDMPTSIKSLRGLVLDMQQDGACLEAQAMLLAAIAVYDKQNPYGLIGVPMEDFYDLVEWTRNA